MGYQGTGNGLDFIIAQGQDFAKQSAPFLFNHAHVHKVQ